MSFLDTDPITVPGQAFALISVVPNEDKSMFGLKIRGVFGTKEEAGQHAQRLSAAEGARFDIYLVDMYKWLCLPPPEVASIGEVVYSEKKLNEMLQDYEQNRAGAKQLFEQRKLEVMQDGLDKHLTEEERIPPPPTSESGGALPSGQFEALFNEDDPLTARQRESDQ